MEIILIVFLLCIAGSFLYVLYTLLRWILVKKQRAVSAFVFIVAVSLVFILYQHFFLKLEFVQSNVYPELYLVKNTHKVEGDLDRVIEDFVREKLRDHEGTSQENVTHSLRFYTYTKSYNPLVFGDSGTAYFIDHEEDLTGMVVEDISVYIKQKLADFTVVECDGNKTVCGELQFFDEGWPTEMVRLGY